MRQGADLVWGVLERSGELLSSVGRLAAKLGLAALAAGVLAWWALWVGLPSGPDRTPLLIVAAILLAAPPAVLLFTYRNVREMTRLPRRLREAPSTARVRVDEIRRRSAEASAARGQGAIHRAVALVRLWGAIAAVRDDVGALSPFLVSTASLVAAVVAAGFAVVEILAGVVALVWLALR